MQHPSGVVADQPEDRGRQTDGRDGWRAQVRKGDEGSRRCDPVLHVDVRKRGRLKACRTRSPHVMKAGNWRVGRRRGRAEEDHTGRYATILGLFDPSCNDIVPLSPILHAWS